MRKEPNDLGLLLRHWRGVRGTSQLELALDVGISQRHLSFIESGRSAPSRQTLAGMVQSLDVPLRERNTVFLAAGSVARSLIRRVYRETVGHVLDERTQALLDDLFAYPGIDASWRQRGSIGDAPSLPMIPMGFHKDGKILSYFSMVTCVGAPQTIAAQEFRIESMFPSDEETEAFHEKWMSA